MISVIDLNTGLHKGIKLTKYAEMLINESIFRGVVDKEMHYIKTTSIDNGKVTDYLPNSKFTQSCK